MFCIWRLGVQKQLILNSLFLPHFLPLPGSHLKRFLMLLSGPCGSVLNHKPLNKRVPLAFHISDPGVALFVGSDFRRPRLCVVLL